LDTPDLSPQVFESILVPIVHFISKAERMSKENLNKFFELETERREKPKTLWQG
jgi:hypothetical protein